MVSLSHPNHMKSMQQSKGIVEVGLPDVRSCGVSVCDLTWEMPGEAPDQP